VIALVFNLILVVGAAAGWCVQLKVSRSDSDRTVEWVCLCLRARRRSGLDCTADAPRGLLP